jgi:uncharacterized membrane protein YcaP (DUF421 family)
MNWHELLFGDESVNFLFEIALRSVIMFLLIFLGLRVAGRRGVRQLSIFELLIIISLGSAAGDPMIYKEIGIINSLVAFAVVFFVYWLITKLVEHSDKMENILEGEPMFIIRDGKVSKEALKNKVLAGDEFFASLRFHSFSHMGQVKAAILETSGEVSILPFKDDEVKPGLPVWPDLLHNMYKAMPADGVYACYKCGNTKQMTKREMAKCSFCKKNDEWVEAIN